MADEMQQSADGAKEVAEAVGETEPVTTVAGAVLGAFFDELGKSEDLKEKAAKLRTLVLGDGVMAEPAIRAILFPEAS